MTRDITPEVTREQRHVDLVCNEVEPALLGVRVEALRVVDVTDLCHQKRFEKFASAWLKYGRYENEMFTALEEVGQIPARFMFKPYIRTYNAFVPARYGDPIHLGLNESFIGQAALFGFDSWNMADTVFRYLPE